VPIDRIRDLATASLRTAVTIIPMPLLDVRGLHVSFPTPRGRRLPAVRDVSFSIEPGEVLGLVGESGSGKSVTSLAIMRLLESQAQVAGQVLFEDHDLQQFSQEDMRRLRGLRMAMIFQEPMTALNPVMRVGDQVAEAVLVHLQDGDQDTILGMLRARGIGIRGERRDAADRAVEMLKLAGITDAERRSRDYPHQLSGGMRQRVMIAIAIVNRPQLLIADEPTTALDVTIQAQILDLLAELREKFGLAMLFISHDLAVVARVSHRVAVMYGGSIVETAPVAEIFRAAAHPYTRGLLKSVPTLRTDRGRPLQTIEGVVPSIHALPPGCVFEPRCELRVDACSLALPPLLEVAPGHWARCPVTAAQESL
jgi:oligopeptide/dipeptide ABC transporter ATP-binding protein